MNQEEKLINRAFDLHEICMIKLALKTLREDYVFVHTTKLNNLIKRFEDLE